MFSEIKFIMFFQFVVVGNGVMKYATTTIRYSYVCVCVYVYVN